jgi:peptidoglycan biosynthesis protein MviN/MurJ (putative lipid II flippase)
MIKKITNMSQRGRQFNKEILLAEIGSMILAPIFAYLASYKTNAPGYLSLSAVIGSIIGGSIFWLIFRVKHGKTRGDHSKKQLARDIMFYTPAALIAAWLIYHPSLFFISEFLLRRNEGILLSIITAQIIGFLLFLITLNIYRQILRKHFGKDL